MKKKSEMLREQLKENKPLFIPGAFNGMSARILEKVGFDAVYMTGYGTSLNLLGMPDAGYATMTEMVMNAKYMNNSISAPLISDADTGYGNALNVRRTITEFIQAGVAGVHIEDQIMPKRCGHVAGRQLVPIEEAVSKYKAANDARNELDPDFLLIARTDARGAYNGGIDEAIRRGNAYAEAGADVIFIEGPTSEDEVKTFCKKIDKPILYNSAGVSPRISLQRLGEIGVSMVILPGATMRVAAEAMFDFATKLKQEGVLVEKEWKEGFESNHPIGDFHDFAGFSEVKKLEEQYLTESELDKYKNSIGFQP
ncbi:isocitrate lyase/PEP mutase family protein [Salicibibacter cibarius]|uniref:Isocitrate lyase/PEP mutase family protein n=1 Tax=Salicibibacter cibarius TaxID=2743000 RepID=A0A7T6Z6Q3_9BACI|nr:isocitrate lyase/PEP mutase family protein [Salicibibacter cibarius]QQK77811.1 isocitrate lyase/PEP mutase family protein [Salicibibacter cibarius]